MSSIRSFVLRGLIFLAVIYSMVAGLYYSWGVYKNYSSGRLDYVSQWESRMVDLKKAIPAGEKRVGYASDWDLTGFDKDSYIEFILTQYTLAPLFLERSLNHEWIIVNSTSSEFLGRVTNQITDPFTVRDFGSGIYLIHKGDQ
ncbi:MAG: hypothetical protein IH589_14940 [Anaerolineales bacterium]|nr:hypothetical protein [Anaerolineales bacterium]